MSIGIGKTSNEYAALAYGVDAPKTVFMALAVSFVARAGVSLTPEEIEEALMREWELLYLNHIVPQKPRRA